jgi:hypothetical protein
MLKPHTALLALTALLGTAAAHAVTIVPTSSGGA